MVIYQNKILSNKHDNSTVGKHLLIDINMTYLKISAYQIPLDRYPSLKRIAIEELRLT